MTAPDPAAALRTVELLPPGRLVLAGNRLLAGVGNNAFRAWVFPLCTPRGLNVLQEYAFDHPFHNGIFVGQAAVTRDGVESNFWAIHADPRQPDNPLLRNLGSIAYPAGPDVEAAGEGIRFTWRSTWMGSDGRPCLDEERRVTVRALADAVLVEVVSAKRAAHGALRFGATKAGAITTRVQPQLLPALGGEVVAVDGAQLRRGIADAAVGAQPCDAVAYENDLPGLGRSGVCLCAPSDSSSEDRRGPWFVRDYGMAVYAPTLKRAVDVPAGGTWTTSLRVIAYDGAIDAVRTRRWATA